MYLINAYDIVWWICMNMNAEFTDMHCMEKKTVMESQYKNALEKVYKSN